MLYIFPEPDEVTQFGVRMNVLEDCLFHAGGGRPIKGRVASDGPISAQQRQALDSTSVNGIDRADRVLECFADLIDPAKMSPEAKTQLLANVMTVVETERMRQLVEQIGQFELVCFRFQFREIVFLERYERDLFMPSPRFL